MGEEDGQRPRCSLQIMHAKGKCERTRLDSALIAVSAVVSHASTETNVN